MCIYDINLSITPNNLHESERTLAGAAEDRTPALPLTS